MVGVAASGSGDGVRRTVLPERLKETLIAMIPINIPRLIIHPMGGYNHIMGRKPDDDVGSLLIAVHVNHIAWSSAVRSL